MNVTMKLFGDIIEKYILPLLPIAHEGRVIEMADFQFSNLLSDKTVQTLHVEDNDYIVFSPRQNNPSFYYISRLSCGTNHLKTVKIVLDGLLSIVSGLQIGENDKALYYVDALCQASVTLGICTLLTANAEEALLLANTVKALEAWTQRTYEGQRVPFGIIIDYDDKENCDEKQDYLSFLNSKYSASFTDGVFSAILLNAHGKIAEHIALPATERKYVPTSKELRNKQFSLTPTRFANFSRLCIDRRIGIIALSNGDILTIRGTQMVYAKREGAWLAYGYFAFFRPCIDNVLLFAKSGKNKSNKTFTEKVAKTIYQSILDASFSHSGACIAVADFRKYGEALSRVLHNCLLLEDIDSSDDFIEKVGKTKHRSMCAKQAIIRQLTHYSNAE